MMQAYHKETWQPVFAYRDLFSKQERWVVVGVGDEPVKFGTFEEAERFVRQHCYDWTTGLVWG